MKNNLRFFPKQVRTVFAVGALALVTLQVSASSRFDSIAYDSNSVTLSVTSATNLTYQIQARTNLILGEWRNVGWASADANGLCQLNVPLSESQEFFRAVQTNVPALTFAVISDVHYMAAELLVSDGTAFQTYLAQDRKLLAQSRAILDPVVAGISNAHPDVVLITGDMTKDGELVSHQHLTNVLQRLLNAGAKVFVCPGNHDVNNPDAKQFDGALATPVASISRDDFTAIYTNFGYSAAIAHDPNSLSYVAEPVPGLRILSMDSCHYERNTNGSPFTGGYFTSDRLAWITNQLAEARDQGKFVIGMMHHGIMEHFIGQKTLFPEYVVDDYATIDNLFSSYGMKVVFTGHFHAQDATKTTLKTGTLFDIETGSCVTFPCPYRLISLETNSVLTVHSFPTTSIDYDLGGLDFPTFAYEFLTNGLHGLVTNMLMSAPYSLPQANASFLAPALVEGMAFHYQGDETSRTISAQSQAIMGYLKSQTDAMSQMMYGVLLCLYNDPALPDNNLRVNLINGLSLTLP